MMLLYAVCGIAIGYQLVALAAVIRHLLRREEATGYAPAVSILKPVRGQDPLFAEAIASHGAIEYGDYEILFGVNRVEDEACAVVEPFLRGRDGRLIIAPTKTANAKVSTLIELAKLARGEVWVVNDGDIIVTPDYLRRVVAPLADPGIVLVTCLYRAVPVGLPAAWEALGIATEFAPSALVAPLVGINEFGLGSTLCFRAEDWRRAGGFEPIGDYLADDYQLAKRLTKGLGKRAYMSKLVVSTSLGYRNWLGVWKHQVRWARTIRASRLEYVGLPVTHAGVWAIVAACCGAWGLAGALVAARMLTGFTAGVILLRSPVAWALPLIPLWDVWAFVVWMAGLKGKEIEWRGMRMRLNRDGKLEPV